MEYTLNKCMQHITGRDGRTDMFTAALPRFNLVQSYQNHKEVMKINSLYLSFVIFVKYIIHKFCKKKYRFFCVVSQAVSFIFGSSGCVWRQQTWGNNDYIRAQPPNSSQINNKL